MPTFITKVGSNCEKKTCVCISSLPETIFVNVLLRVHTCPYDISEEIISRATFTYRARQRRHMRLADPRLVMYGPVRYDLREIGIYVYITSEARARTSCMKCLLYTARIPPRAFGFAEAHSLTPPDRPPDRDARPIL